MKGIDKQRFDIWAKIIESDARTTNTEKASLKIKAWATVASTKNFCSILLDLGRVY